MGHHSLHAVIIRFIQLRLISRLICIGLLLGDTGLLSHKHRLITRQLTQCIIVRYSFLCGLMDRQINLTLSL